MPESKLDLLEGYATKAEFADGIGGHERTVDNYRREPNGLPSLTIAGRVYIPLQEGREWIAARVTKPNPTRIAADRATGVTRPAHPKRPRRRPNDTAAE